MKLADRYSTERLEAACNRALSYTPSPSLKNITTILKNGQDKVKADQSVIKTSGSLALHGEPLTSREVIADDTTVYNR